MVVEEGKDIKTDCHNVSSHQAELINTQMVT